MGPHGRDAGLQADGVLTVDFVSSAPSADLRLFDPIGCCAVQCSACRTVAHRTTHRRSAGLHSPRSCRAGSAA